MKATTGIIACFLSLSLFAQDGPDGKILGEWFSRNSRASLYIGISRDLNVFFEKAGKLSLPGELLLEILDEAAAKNIPPKILLETITIRFSQYAKIQIIMRELQPCLQEENAEGPFPPADLIKKYALFLRQGISEAVISSILRDVCTLGKKNDEALSLLRTLANIPSNQELGEQDLLALAKTILRSTMSPASYTALSSLYIKGKLKNLSVEDITNIIMDVLSEGKGLIRIEQEINRQGGP